MTFGPLSLGCHNLTGGSSLSRSKRLVHCALDLGIRRFDVAPSYGLGTAEKTLGLALGSRRKSSELEITTKYGIAAPRYGRLAAWLREPYRGLRKLAGRAAPSPSITGTAAAAATTSKSVFAVVECSLRAIGIEQIGALLSHERLSDRWAESFADDVQTLVRRGVVARVGCSGEPAHVSYMLSRMGSVAQIAQVGIRHRAMIPDALEKRLFNMGALSRELLQNGSFAAAERDLQDALASRYGLDRVGALMAGLIAWATVTDASAVVIVNASSEQRLTRLVTATAEPSLKTWAEVHHRELTALLAQPA